MSNWNLFIPADEIDFSVQGLDLLIPGGHVQLESVPDVRALLQKISISNQIALCQMKIFYFERLDFIITIIGGSRGPLYTRQFSKQEEIMTGLGWQKVTHEVSTITKCSFFFFSLTRLLFLPASA
jgi:hypothetical protein